MSTPTATTSRAVPQAHRLDSLLAPSGPPRRAGALAASATFGWRAMLKIKHEPKQLTDVIAIPVIPPSCSLIYSAAPSAARSAPTSRASCPALWSWESPPSPCTAALASPRT